MSLGLKLLQATLQGRAPWAVLTSPVFGGWLPVTRVAFLTCTPICPCEIRRLSRKGVPPWLEKQASRAVPWELLCVSVIWSLSWMSYHFSHSPSFSA